MKTARTDARNIDFWIGETLGFKPRIVFEEELVAQIRAIKLEAYRAGLEKAASKIVPDGNPMVALEKILAARDEHPNYL